MSKSYYSQWQSEYTDNTVEDVKDTQVNRVEMHGDSSSVEVNVRLATDQHSSSFSPLQMSRSQTDQILQSTTMPDKVMEVNLIPAVAILDRDTPTQGPGFNQHKFEITTIVHTGSAYDKGT